MSEQNGNTSAWRSGARPVAVMAVAGVLTAITAGCGSEPQFEVGECVRVEERILDFDLKSADCSDGGASLVRDEQIHRIDSVIEGTDGGCPQLRGFAPIEFVHEPDDVTYCLVLNT